MEQVPKNKQLSVLCKPDGFFMERANIRRSWNEISKSFVAIKTVVIKTGDMT